MAPGVRGAFSSRPDRSSRSKAIEPNLIGGVEPFPLTGRTGQLGSSETKGQQDITEGRATLAAHASASGA